MKIVIFAALYYPFQGGYVESIHGLARQFIKRGHSITVVTNNTHHIQRKEILDGVKIFRIPCWNPKFLNDTFPISKPVATIRFFFKFRKEQFDIVSTQTRFFLLSFFGFLFGKLKHTPIIHTERGGSHTVLKNKIITLINLIMDHTFGWMICRFSEKTVGVAEEATNFAKHLGAKNPLTIYNGVDTEFWKNSFSSQKKDHSTTHLVFVGRLIFGKGVQDLLGALSILKKKGLTFFFLTIIGEGPYKKELERLTKELGLIEHISFIGAKNHFEIRDIFQKSDIFINPSYSEGLPRSVLEAGSMGLAIIATNVGGTKEIINTETGLLVPPYNVELLAEAIEKYIIRNDLLEKHGQNIKDHIQKNFDWKKITTQYTDLFGTYV